jgi:hypothetical protein
LSEVASSGMMVAMDTRPQITKQEQVEDVSVIFDLVVEGEPTDISRDKDKMIGDAIWERKQVRSPRRGATERRDDCC